jgi:hypothetical protein
VLDFNPILFESSQFEKEKVGCRRDFPRSLPEDYSP